MFCQYFFQKVCQKPTILTRIDKFLSEQKTAVKQRGQRPLIYLSSFSIAPTGLNIFWFSYPGLRGPSDRLPRAKFSRPFQGLCPVGADVYEMVKESYNLNQDRFGEMICIRAKIQKKPQRG